MSDRINMWAACIFAPLLVAGGAFGLVLPDRVGLMSHTSAYTIFHVVSGIVGIIIILIGKRTLIRLFNIGFGLIDIYQVIAHYLHLFPEEYFRWKPTDDIVHLAVGIVLIGIGCYRYGRKNSPSLSL